MSDSPRRHDRGPRWGLYLLMFLALAVLILLGVWALWSSGSTGRLDRQVALYKTAGEPIEPADFRDVPIDNDEDNVAVALREAAKINTRSKAWDELDKLDLSGLPLRENEIAALRAVVDANAASFAAVDSAMSRKGVDWQVVLKSPTISTLLPDLGAQRVLGRLVAHRALLNAQQGDYAAALADLRRAYFIAAAVDHQPILVSHMVANGIRTLANEQAQLIAPELNIGTGGKAASPKQVAELIALLLDDKSQRDAQRRALQGERMLELDTARCLANGKLTLSQLGAGGPGRPGGIAAMAGVALKPIALDDGLIMIRHTSSVIAAIDASENWPAYRIKAPPEPKDIKDSQIAHVVARMLLPAFDRSVQTEYRVTTDRRLTAAALAIRWYAADHAGKLPERLSDLVPTYLPSVPADAMATNQTLKYINDPTRPIVYSAGDNGVDDGGNEAAMKPNTTVKNLGTWQKLDVVVHLKRQPRPPADDEDATTQPAPRKTRYKEPLALQLIRANRSRTISARPARSSLWLWRWANRGCGTGA